MERSKAKKYLKKKSHLSLSPVTVKSRNCQKRDEFSAPLPLFCCYFHQNGKRVGQSDRGDHVDAERERLPRGGPPGAVPGRQGDRARRLGGGDCGHLGAGLQDPAEPEAAHRVPGDRQEALPDSEARDNHWRYL